MSNPDSAPEKTKTCTGECGQTLPVSSFSKDSSKPDGLRNICRSDVAKRDAAYRVRKLPNKPLPPPDESAPPRSEAPELSVRDAAGRLAVSRTTAEQLMPSMASVGALMHIPDEDFGSMRPTQAPPSSSPHLLAKSEEELKCEMAAITAELEARKSHKSHTREQLASDLERWIRRAGTLGHDKHEIIALATEVFDTWLVKG